jgi:hypothetical protein
VNDSQARLGRSFDIAAPAAQRVALLALLLLLSVGAAACSAIGGIFKAGLWVGLITAALVVVLVLVLVRSISR